VASRRHAEELITGGSVRVNGEVVRILGTRIRPGVDRVQVDGVGVAPEPLLTVMLHKPGGYITAASDPAGRPVVGSLLPPSGFPRLYPVGRLDWDTEGLLLLTNDGALAQFLTHPRHAVRKVYQAKLKGRPPQEALGRLLKGVNSEGEWLQASRVQFLRAVKENSWVLIEIAQGRNRQIRRMCEAIGHPVQKLIRTAVGPLELGGLSRGQWRPLSPVERQALQGLMRNWEPNRP
jgi:23S rRNA pseudouridine2605 synthase